MLVICSALPSEEESSSIIFRHCSRKFAAKGCPVRLPRRGSNGKIAEPGRLHRIGHVHRNAVNQTQKLGFRQFETHTVFINAAADFGSRNLFVIDVVQLFAPGLQKFLFFGNAAVAVDNIVNMPAKGIQSIHGLTFGLGQKPHAPEERCP